MQSIDVLPSPAACKPLGGCFLPATFLNPRNCTIEIYSKAFNQRNNIVML
jgi:hypothetical protein